MLGMFFPLHQCSVHDWISADCESNKCEICHKKIKILTGKSCAWCHRMVSADYFCPDLPQLTIITHLFSCFFYLEISGTVYSTCIDADVVLLVMMNVAPQ